MPDHHIAIVGAGIGGLACAARLAAAGARVTLFDSQPTPGGKLRQLTVGGLAIDAGPTVCTMRWVFQDLFAACGATLEAAVELTPLGVLARHAWAADTHLDLFADRAATVDAIAAFAGPAEARGYLAFAARARRIYQTLEPGFIRGDKPTPLSLFATGGLDVARISPFTTLWNALGSHFKDPRLRQLFARYATYCGASPMAAPATLMLIAHVEQEGVWTVHGGLTALAKAIMTLAASHGAAFRPATPVAAILTTHGRATGLRLASGETITADAIVLNADAAALTAGLFGEAARIAIPPARDARSLSALTFAIAGRPAGFPLSHHNVFFSDDYPAEFAALSAGRMPNSPSIYLCAADRPHHIHRPGTPDPPERLFAILNAPATGDTDPTTQAEIDTARHAMTRLFRHCGLELTCDAITPTTPTQFNTLFPATGGALYGRATHGPMASFRRPGARTKLPGLYLTGGSVHPGPGVPMAALSARLAAASLLQDLAAPRRTSPPPSRRTAIAGGTSTR